MCTLHNHSFLFIQKFTWLHGPSLLTVPSILCYTPCDTPLSALVQLPLSLRQYANLDYPTAPGIKTIHAAEYEL